MFEYIKLDDDNYELLSPYYYEWDNFELVIDHSAPQVKYSSLTSSYILLVEGYCWDGATGAVDTETIMKASAVHDALCVARQQGLIPNTFKVRVWIDKILYRICRENGMSRFRAMYVYIGVRVYRRAKIRVIRWTK